LFLLGAVCVGGFFHGRRDLTYGVDIEKIRWFGVLQVAFWIIDVVIFVPNFSLSHSIYCFPFFCCWWASYLEAVCSFFGGVGGRTPHNIYNEKVSRIVDYIISMSVVAFGGMSLKDVIDSFTHVSFAVIMASQFCLGTIIEVMVFSWEDLFPSLYAVTVDQDSSVGHC